MKKGCFMNKPALIRILPVFLVFFVSCISPPNQNNAFRPIKKVPNAVVIGAVETVFVSNRVPGYRYDNKQISEASYIELLKKAKKEYGNNVDIVNITWAYRNIGTSFWDVRNEISARGNVITINQNVGIENALLRASKDIVKNVPLNSTIAIVYVTAQDKTLIDYISSELEFVLIKDGYIICDRSQLDLIRQEQNFQLSGEVDDASAVSIGKILGADFIITGRVHGNTNLRRLRLRIMNTQTAQVIGAASEEW
jgi:hypothetical protein